MAKSKGFVGVMLCGLALITVSAQAGVMGTATLVANPPAVNFTTDTALNSPPLSDTWVSYVLGLSTDDGSKISAVDVTISGPLHQRWTFNADSELFDPTPSSTNKTNGDSHLTPLGTSTIASAPSENNNLPSALPVPADTAARDYGVGSLLSGAWGYIAADQASNIDFAYIVVPKSQLPQLQINVRAATNPDQNPPLVVLDTNDFFGPTNTAPDVGDKNVEWFSQNPPVANSDTLPLIDDAPAGGVWSLESFTGLDGKLPGPNAPSVNPATGLFSWIGNGSQDGTYNAVLKFTDAGGLADTGTLGIRWHVPEPSTFALFGLALVGFAGYRRK